MWRLIYIYNIDYMWRLIYIIFDYMWRLIYIILTTCGG